MKKGINIIQIKGATGFIIAAGIVCCLFAGFVVFPGWTAMHLWNFISNYVQLMPKIGIMQGVLLWGILAASYYTFRKDKHFVYMRAPMMEGLSEEELKKVFADIKEQAKDDPILQSMIKAREAELKIKNLSQSGITEPKEIKIINSEEKLSEDNESQNILNTNHK